MLDAKTRPLKVKGGKSLGWEESGHEGLLRNKFGKFLDILGWDTDVEIGLKRNGW